MITTNFGASRVRRLQEGYLDPEDEFFLAVENLDSILSTARGLVGSILAMCTAYDEELGDFAEGVEEVRVAVDDAASVTGELFGYLEELDNPEEGDEGEGEDKEGEGEETSDEEEPEEVEEE